MYYIYSLVLSLIVYFILHTFYRSQNKFDKEKKENNTIENVFTFIVLYIIITIVCYFIDQNMLLSSNNKSENNEYDFSKPIKSNVDINLLKKIPEEVNTGFNISDSSDSE